MRNEYEEWQAELRGDKPSRSGLLIFIAVVIVIIGLAGLSAL